ncbi:MAG TPA: hypothetical protein VND21_09935, partial [Planctomycetota bacterium]|nr:hypothetical protein [Planctomycetota bacterium]
PEPVPTPEPAPTPEPVPTPEPAPSAPTPAPEPTPVPTVPAESEPAPAPAPLAPRASEDVAWGGEASALPPPAAPAVSALGPPLPSPGPSLASPGTPVDPGDSVPVPDRAPARPPTVAPPSRPSSPDGAAVAVPTLVGRPALEAFETAIRVGLRPRAAVASEPGDVDPVRRQDPAAGAAARAGAVVTLSIGPGAGATPADVPDVTGLTTSDAATRLKAAGRTARVFRVEAPAAVFPDRDKVLAQWPMGRVATDAPVLLFIAR